MQLQARGRQTHTHTQRDRERDRETERKERKRDRDRESEQRASKRHAFQKLPFGGKQKVNVFTDNVISESTKFALLISKPSVVD